MKVCLRSIKNKGCEEGAKITKQSPFPKCLFSSDDFVAVAVVACLSSLLTNWLRARILIYHISSSCNNDLNTRVGVFII